MKGRSLAFRLTLYLGGAWVLLFLAWGGVIWQTTHRLVTEAQQDKARALARQLATVSLDAVLMRDYGTVERYLADLAREGDLVWVEIQRGDGRVIGSAGQRLAGVTPQQAELSAAGETVGRVSAQYDPRPAQRAAWQLAGLLALGLALLAVVTFVALRRLLMQGLVAPVTALIAQAGPDPAPPPAAPLPAEVAELAAAIDALRERIKRHLAEAEEAGQSHNEALRRLCSEQRLAAVGQLAGEVAHELNTPLSNILGYAQSALPQAEAGEVREALEVIEAQARRSGQIVRDMLTAARAPAPALQDADLAQIAAAFGRLVTPLARKQGCTLRVEAADPAPVRADPAQVEQILFNLVFNALQAGAREVRLTADPAARALSVADDGPGLPESVRARLFEPFVTTKPAGQGTGLGLAICQRLAREMGAELACDQPGPGCVFSLRFPAE